MIKFSRFSGVLLNLNLQVAWKLGQSCTSKGIIVQNFLCSSSINKFATQKNQNNLLKTYHRVRTKKEAQKKGTGVKNQINEQNQAILNQQESEKINSAPNDSQQYLQNQKVRCQGCNVRLQSKDKQKYGFIEDKILKEALADSKKGLTDIMGQKIQDKDVKYLNFLHQVQKETGIKIFNDKTKQLDNLNDLDVLMRLEDKIDRYEKQSQLLNPRKKSRRQILCFRCFSLKHHNRLPEQYDNNLGFSENSTEFILNKILNRHKESETEYLYIVDAFDILGTFQEWLFKRMIQNKLNFSIVVNKIDVINKQYINQIALYEAINSKIKNYLKIMDLSGSDYEATLQRIKIFYVSCNSRDGMKKLKSYLEAGSSHIQLVGYPNTGKTSLLNILAKLKKSTSRIPGTTIKITEHSYNKSKRRVYDMPGLYSENLLYNLIEKPSIKSMLTWHKRISPGLLTGQAFIYGGKLEIKDTRIIVFGLGGACQSNNKWFIGNHRQFWRGLPPTNVLKIKKHEIELSFVNGRANDLQIAGYGFIGFRLCIPNIKQTKRTLYLYLPQKIEFSFRKTILSVNDAIFHNKSGLTKKFMLQRLTLNKFLKDKKNEQRLKKTISDNQSNINENQGSKQSSQESDSINDQTDENQDRLKSLKDQYVYSNGEIKQKVKGKESNPQEEESSSSEGASSESESHSNESESDSD